MIHSLLDHEWSHMKLFITYSENAKTFIDIFRHMKLEAEWQEANRSFVPMARAKGGPRHGPKRIVKLIEKRMKNQNARYEKPKIDKPLKGKRGKPKI